MFDGEMWKYSDPSRADSHGVFSGRLTPGCLGTDEGIGFSMWHLVAAKLVSPQQQADFLVEANQATADALIDDIREGMAVFPAYYENNYLERIHDVGTYTDTWEELVSKTSFKSTLEICEGLGVPLILWPLSFEFKEKLHPVIQAAQRESYRRCGWPNL
jgi:hypothetical protein